MLYILLVCAIFRYLRDILNMNLSWLDLIFCCVRPTFIQFFYLLKLCFRSFSLPFWDNTCNLAIVIFLYARLQTGRIMVWWCPSVRVSVRPSQFSALFSYVLWDITLKFCTSLYLDARKIKFEYHQFPSIFAGVMPLLNFTLLQICSFLHISHTCFDILSWNFAYDFFFTLLQIKFECRKFASIFVGVTPLLELRILEIHSFPHFSLTSFDILSWNFSYDFVLLYYSSSLSIINLRQFLLECCPFWNLEYWKYTVFRTFLLHALIYWAEILHATIFYLTTDQVWVSSICVNFCRSYAPFGTYNTGNTQFSALFSYILWHIELKLYIWLCLTVLQIKFECRQFASIFVGVMPLLELRLLEIHSLPYFSPTCFDILSWNFLYVFVKCTID